ncbi:phenylalanine--tRNA ligase subunit beta [Anaplasma bovis]|uniref:phenylalanine--tRNA ligase subunit beta n=1 Tax=Anaplasma bovis TaxID=186733 RepID=UPI002FF294CF
MRFAYSWLLDYLGNIHCSADFLVDKLSSIGIEAQLLPSLREEYGDSFVVAKVEEVKPHPRADKLVICDVFDGCAVSKVVCGAPNVRKGMLTVLAKEGSVVPKSGTTISRVSIRGEESCGMLCSLSELDVSAEDSSGIVDLSGFDVGEIFFPADKIIEITITPNRGDCLGIYGIARELAAAGVGALKQFPAANLGDLHSDVSPIDVEMRCDGAFAGRVIRSVKNGECPPRLIMDRLMSSGIKLVSCVVDILNYVMLLLNRPMHVYDMDALGGNLLIGKSAPQEKIKALNGKIYELTTDDIVVKDSGGTVHCLAGIMGAEVSACARATKDIFLESAWYDPVTIAVSSRVHNVSTEAAHRFSRHVDLGTIKAGLDLATSLVLQYCGGKPCASVESSRNVDLPDVTIDFRVSSIARICNVSIAEERVAGILESLGFSVGRSDDEKLWKVKVPSWRVLDVKSEIDLVEEVIRIHGYDDIRMEEVGPPCSGGSSCENTSHLEQKMRTSMLSSGLTEVVTWSFLASSVAEKFGFSVDDMRIENPISNQFDVMRPTILANLLQVSADNQACGSESVSIFEMGDIYLSIDRSEHVVCALRSGNFLPKNLHSEIRGFDFFDVKSDVEQLLVQFGVSEDDLRYVPSSGRSYMHPGRSADIYLRDVLCGYVGEVHPEIIEFLKLKHSAVCFEVFTESIKRYSPAEKKSGFCVNKYQPVKRDFAFVLDKTVSAATLVDSIKSIRNVEEVRVFDVYNGDGISENKTSIAVSVVISSREGTMTEDDIKSVSDDIILSVERKTSGKLRLDYEL